MDALRIPDQIRFWEPEADRLLLLFVQQALDEGGTVLDGCQRFTRALQSAGPRVTPSPEQMAMRWEVLQTFGGRDPARDPQAIARLPGVVPATVEGNPGSLAQVARELRRLADELQRLAWRLEQMAQVPSPTDATGPTTPAAHAADEPAGPPGPGADGTD